MTSCVQYILAAGDLTDQLFWARSTKDCNLAGERLILNHRRAHLLSCKVPRISLEHFRMLFEPIDEDIQIGHDVAHTLQRGENAKLALAGTEGVFARTWWQ